MRKITLKQIGLNYYNTRSDKDYTVLYNRITPGIRKHIYGFVKDFNISEDLVAMTMTKVYNKIDQFDPMYNMSTWIYTIASNEARQYLRKKKRNGHVLFSAMEYTDDAGNKTLSGKLDALMSVENDYVINEAIMEEETEIKKMYDKTIAVIEKMKPSFREILIDRFVNELSYKELAAKYDVPLMTIKNRVTRGKQRINAAIEAETND